MRESHDVAVERVLGYLEREACMARRGRGGREHVRGGGFLAAAFPHRSSRAGDPLLHTHVVVGNLTRVRTGGGPRSTGGCSTATRRPLASYTRPSWAPSSWGDSASSSVRLTRAAPTWSAFHARCSSTSRSARAEIVARMEAHGCGSAKAAQVAALETRRAKETVPNDRLRDEWRDRASKARAWTR